jgi:hypothetical protein
MAITIAIRLSDGSKVDVPDIEPSMTIEDVKRAIEHRVSPPCAPELQRLIYKGRILKDGDSVEGLGACTSSCRVHSASWRCTRCFSREFSWCACFVWMCVAVCGVSGAGEHGMCERWWGVGHAGWGFSFWSVLGEFLSPPFFRARLSPSRRSPPLHRCMCAASVDDCWLMCS